MPRLPCGNAGQEQGGRRIVDQRWTNGSRFIQCASAQPAPAQSGIQIGKPEWHDPVIAHGKRHLP